MRPCYELHRSGAHRRSSNRWRAWPWWLLVLSLLLALGLPGQTLAALPGPLDTLSPADKIDAELRGQTASDPLRLWPVIVEMAPLPPPFPARGNEVLAQSALSLLTQFGRPVGGLPLINAAAGFANAVGVAAISADPRVANVYADSTMQALAGGTSNTPLATAYPQSVGADRVWQRGPRGTGVGVAVLDSGIARDGDLTQPRNRLVAAANFAGDRGPLDDGGGHGTHVAGIAAGNGYRSGGEYVGIAPDANVVDVRVLDNDGSGRISSVVRAIEWVLAHRTAYNIRLINLSLGTAPRPTYRADPLAAAVEIAWLRGVAVVAAAGNTGPNSGTVASPGYDPYVITVGATDDRGTATADDDLLADFSSWGSSIGSTAKPDVVAPGRRIVSLRVIGSYLDTHYPDRVTTARNGSTYFRLSGTSMSTPVVSGAVALLLQQQPTLSPDRIKAALMGSTQSYGSHSGATLPDPSADGAGLLDAFATTYSSPRPPTKGGRPADTLARALYPVLYGTPLVWKDSHYQGIDWTQVNWSNLVWDNLAWDNLAWDNLAWDNLAWDNLAWDNLAWDNLAWDNLAWDNLAWDNLAWDSAGLD